MRGFKQAIAVLTLAGLSSGGAQAGDLFSDFVASSKDGPGYWVVTVGGYVGAQPEFPGAKSYTFGLWPIIDIRPAGSREWVTLPTDALSLTLYQTPNFRAGVAGDYILGRNHNDDSDVAGLHDINVTLLAGGFAEYYPAPFLRTRVELLQGFTGSDGLVARFAGDYIIRPDYHWMFTAGPRLQFANTQYVSEYFSVNPVESVRSGLPVYRASGGLNTVGLDATVRYYFNDRFSVRAFVDWEHLVGDAADSPIVKFRGSEDQIQVGIGAAFTFNYGPQPLK
ncbi:MAG TPA: MipA/OmpV family protein [Hyphomicrobiales bacterium]|nr:MipA/OmpV family protein [Hyphomicrobiales bacterium]